MRLHRRKSNTTTPPATKFNLVGLIFALGFLVQSIVPLLGAIDALAN